MRSCRWWLLGLLAVGCNGIIGEPGADGPTPTVDDPRNPGQRLPAFEPVPASLRRLTAVQYDNSVEFLLGGPVDLEGLTVDDPVAEDEFRFTNELTAEVTTAALEVEKYDAAAREAAGQVFASAERREALVGCTPTSASDACVTSFLESFLRRAFRRPVGADEVESYRSVVTAGEVELDSVWQGLRYAVATVLQSPSFLYRAELGDGHLLDGYEVASRLSFLLLDTTPDDALLDEAEAGILDDDEGLLAAADRLLADPRSEDALGRFFSEWLGISLLDLLTKNPDVFPDFSTAVATSMRRELEAQTLAVITGEQSLLDLYTTDVTWVDGRLASFYGIDTGAEGLASEIEHFEAEDGSPGGCEVVAGYANVCSEGELGRDVVLPADGVHRFSVRAYGAQAGPETVRYALEIDGVEVDSGELRATADAPEILSVEATLTAGSHRFAIRFLNDYYMPPDNRDLRVDWLKVEALDGMGTGGELMRVALPPERRGILSLAGVLALRAQPIDTSPTQRGLFIRTHLLCEDIPPPPPGVETTLPPPGGEIRTTRDRVERHMSDENCAGCHSRMDPLGLPLEHFDGIGMYRPDHDGYEIDASGDLDGVTFDGAIGLAETLAADQRVADCIVRQMFRHGLGHEEEATQEISIVELSDAYASEGHSLRALLRAFLVSDAFRTAGAGR